MTVTNGFGRTIGSVAVVVLSGAMLLAQQYPEQPTYAGPPAQQGAPPQLLAPNQLDSLVAPVALYPDALLSQVLVASTYPMEITEAAQWLQQTGGLQGQQLADAARQQNWDPSIQALVVFPDVMRRLASDMQWTTDLGNAFLAQQADVMAAVQRLRAQAMEAGRLSSNAQQTVTSEYDGGQEAIQIAPANPEVVYVPYYNPAYIWGPPAWGYYPAWDDFGIGFGWGPGIYISGFFGGLGWGGWGWGCNWFHRDVFVRPYFFAHYGFRGYAAGRGWGGYSAWSHNPGHRLGVPYANRTVATRYGGTFAPNRGWNNAQRSAGQAYAGSHQPFAGRTNAGATGGNRSGGAASVNANRATPAPGGSGWNRFGGAAASASAPRPGQAHSAAPGNSYGASRAPLAGNAYRYGTSNGRSYSAPSSSYNRSYSAPSARYSAPSYSRGYSAPSSRYSSPPVSRGYSSAPSYHYSSPPVSRGYSAPSYHYSSPPASRGYGGGYSVPRSNGGGGGYHGGGGGGGVHSGGGGGGSHPSGGGGGGSHGGGHR